MAVRGFNMAGAKQGGQREKTEAPAIGTYLCKCLNMRAKNTRGKGAGFFLEYEIISCVAPQQDLKGNAVEPSAPGHKHTYMIFPEDARVPAGGKLTKEDVIALEFGKVQAAVAAVAGWSKAEAGNVNDEYFEKATQGSISPLSGRHFILDVVPHQNKKGADSYFCAIYPAPEADQKQAAPAPQRSAAPAPAKPPAKPAPAAPAFPPAGWQAYPDEADCFFNAATGESAWGDELRARLAG